MRKLSYYTTALHSYCQYSFAWRGLRRQRVFYAAELWLLPTSPETLSLEFWTICQFDTSVPPLISLSWKKAHFRRLSCAQFQSWQKGRSGAVCGTGVLQMIIDWGQCRVGMSEVKWLYPGAETDQGETWETDSSPAGGQRVQTKPFRITLQYQTWSLSYRLINQFWVPHLTTPQVQTKG